MTKHNKNSKKQRGGGFADWFKNLNYKKPEDNTTGSETSSASTTGSETSSAATTGEVKKGLFGLWGGKKSKHTKNTKKSKRTKKSKTQRRH